MPPTTTVSELRILLEPMFASMLTLRELRTLEFDIELFDASGDPLPPEAPVTIDARVTWRIMDEGGGSGGLPVDEGADRLVRFVQSDLQDFVSESGFGWGQLRGPRDLP